MLSPLTEVDEEQPSHLVIKKDNSSRIMGKIEFAGNWKEVFASCGIYTAADLYDYKGGEIINTNSKRNVSRFTLTVDGAEKVFFMKRFHHQHYKDTLFAFRNYFKLMSLGEIEWRNIYMLLNNGIDTYHPVCFGVVNPSLRNMCSLVVTEEIGGECLSDIVAGGWSGLDEQYRRRLLDAVAALAAKVHIAKLSLPDLYVWHYFITGESDGGVDMAVIDLHRMKLRAGEGEFIRNMGSLHYSMYEKYFTPQERNYVIEQYCRIRGIAYDRFATRAINRSRIVTARRRNIEY